ncbi:MAG: hypothetical protein Q8O64_14585 [Sideroxyarcus sp.]|nr:hypothetical protein [Sideroxyarcus sp.]
MAGANTFGRRGGGGSDLLTDEQIIQARKLHELKGIKRKPLAELFGVEPGFMGKILQYHIRGRLFIEDHPDVAMPDIPRDEIRRIDVAEWMSQNGECGTTPHLVMR